MGIPELIKSPYTLGGLGAAGTGAVGIAGWQYLASNTEQISIPDNLFKEGTNGCDILLFGQGVVTGYSSGTTETLTDEKFLQPDTSITLGTTGNTLGCMSINANSSNIGNSLMKFVFKNDETGWFLRSSIEEESSSKYSLTHNLFLLKKESDNWKVKKGFEWTDSKLTSLSNGAKLTVKIPWQMDTEITIGTSASDFVGVWEFSSEQGKKGILEEVGLTKGSDKSDILGRTEEELKQGDISAKKFYDTTSSPAKWKKVGTSNKNIKDIIFKWYDPFKNAKGGWTDAKEYCNKHKDDLTSVKIQGLCVKSK